MRNLIGSMLLLSCLAACNSQSSSNTSKMNDTTMQQSNDKEWIKSTNIYEVNVRQYTKEGTFNGSSYLMVHAHYAHCQKKYERRYG
jgi:hypothetical protein